MNFTDIKTLTIIENKVSVDGEELEIQTSLDDGIDAVQFHKGIDFCLEEPNMTKVALEKYQYALDEYVIAKDLIDNPTLTLDEVKQNKISELSNSINYEDAVLVGSTYFKGGYESAQKLNSKRMLVIETDGAEVTYLNFDDDAVTLTLEQAKAVCIAVANDYEVKFYQYKTKKKEILACETISELEAIII